MIAPAITPTTHRIPGGFLENSHRSRLAFEEAAVALDLEPWIIERFRHPEEESSAYLELIRDSGDAICVPLIQVQHSSTYGPTAGSLAIAPDLQLRDCEAVAMQRSWQAALLGLPFGGASYGLVCDADELSERDLVRLLALAGRQLGKPGVPGSLLFPGRGCHRELIPRLYGELRNSRDLIIAGKPSCLGGVNLDQFVAEGIAAMVSSALEHAGKSPEGAKVAIQGFGALGQTLAQRLADDGLTIVALSDSSGGLYRSDGLILNDILAEFRHEHLLFGYAEAEHISRAELLHTKADVLVVSAGMNEIDDNNRNAVSARLMVEADWSAATSLATRHRAADDLMVIPWLLASAGALLGSYFESRDLQILSTPQELLARTQAWLAETMVHVFRYAAANQLSFGEATHRLAIEKAAECLRAAGSAYSAAQL